MDRSYKIYKSYHTSHHNTTKTHLQISTPPSSVQQRTDIHNLPPNHMESQPSKLQASSNAPTLTTSPANHKESQPFLPAIQHNDDGTSLTFRPQETQPFLPAIQRSDDGTSLTFRPQETQPFLPAIQRSADGSSNSRQTTLSLPT